MHIQKNIINIILSSLFVLPILAGSPLKRKRFKSAVPYLPINDVKKVCGWFGFCSQERRLCQNEHILTLFSSNGKQPIVTVLIYDNTALKEVYKKEGPCSCSFSNLLHLSVLKSWIYYSFFCGMTQVPDERSRDMSGIIQELALKNDYKGSFDMLVMSEYERIKNLPFKQTKAMIASFGRNNLRYPEEIIQIVSAFLLPKKHAIDTIAYPERWM